MRKERIIDLSSKGRNSDFNITLEKFLTHATPLWFKWLGWMFATGAISYLAIKTDSYIMFFLRGICLILIYLYFMYYMTSIKIEPYFTWKKFRAKKNMLKFMRFIELILMSAILLSSHFMFEEIIDLIIKSK